MKANNKKWIFYSLVMLFSALLAFLVCLFATKEGVFYSICWGLLAGGIGGIAARIGFHLAMKDNSPEMWQVTIYLSMAVIGWLIAVLGTVWVISSIGLAMVIGFLLMALGTRLIRYKGNWIHETIPLDIENAMASQRWKFKNDDPSQGDDYNNAICSINGIPLTVEEAEKQGYIQESKEGLEYLKRVLEKESE